MHPVTERSIERILNRNRVMTLATMRPDGFPQATVVTFAHDGLTLFIAVDATSQKARNIRRNNKVSVAMGQDKRDWSRITGLSMAGQARVLRRRDEIEWAKALLTRRFPQIKEMGGADDYAGWAFIEVVPLVISVLDYTQGPGDTKLVKLWPTRALQR
ncbi:MAG: pyridoxamine 5'-phosphate oxidase family protein [Gemmatimonadota bacterium]